MKRTHLDAASILSATLRIIKVSLPQLTSFVQEGTLQKQFSCFLDHLEVFLEGREMPAEAWSHATELARELAVTAVASGVDVEDLIQATYHFRHEFWSHLEKNITLLSSVAGAQLLPTIRKANEYLSQVNLEIMREYLHKERAVVASQKRQLDLDLELARQIQQSMFPSQCQFGAFKLCGHMLPSGAVGGDFYGVVPFGQPEHRIDFYLGDVQGKGIPAALVMMMANSTLWDTASANRNPAQIVSGVNRRFRLHMTSEPSLFVSLFYVSYDLESRTITYTKAGHEDGLLIRSHSGEIVTLSTPGYFLGAFDEVECDEKKLAVGPGDRLYLYTDGISALGSQTAEKFGYEEFVALLLEHHPLPISEALERICGRLTEMSGEEPLKDDIGLVVVEF